MCAQANRGVTNIVLANNVLLPQDSLTENWNLVQMIGGIFRYQGCFELVGETKVDK